MFRHVLAVALVTGLSSPTAAADAPKHVVLLVADDLGLQLGCYGDATARTPNLDRLAAQGTRFTHGFASVASCSASRATLLTGMPTHQCGQFGHAHAEHNVHSFRTVRSLPQLLNAAGYRTGVVGKLHVLPQAVYPFHVEAPARNVVQIATQVRQFLAGREGKPFFLHVGFAEPHRTAKGFGNQEKQPAGVPAVTFDPKTVAIPSFLPDNADARGEWAEYLQAVARLDHGVGLVLRELELAGVLNDTLVIFLSDNGPPFQGAKTTLYDPGVHLPLVVRRPGTKHVATTAAMASWTDIAPTILDWAGVPAPKGLPGRSIAPGLTHANPEGWNHVYGSHQFHEITMYYPTRMVRTRTHKYLLNLAHGLEVPHASDLWASPTWQGVLSRGDRMFGRRTVAAYLNRPREELYDLTADQDELRNLAADPAAAGVLGQLRASCRAWQEATSDPWVVKYRHE
ncbi:sulfatase family protein [Urbifossiella limnaea]|uniref:Arylsulfatase n=1 Tax=Urbifossiella limnaea TaxID=2528023 RepID=A0A517XVJ9_9BACT|nr:sulfatase [Urbifossiella limnaea]QDU21519.1 Arylsulfatase [Urbifossiella limnaea]